MHVPELTETDHRVEAVTVKIVKPEPPGTASTPDPTRLMDLRPNERKEFTFVPGIPGVGDVVEADQLARASIADGELEVEVADDLREHLADRARHQLAVQLELEAEVDDLDPRLAALVEF